MSQQEGPVFYCDFCRKSQHQVFGLIAAPSLGDHVPAICNECVDLCNDIVRWKTMRKMTEADLGLPLSPTERRV